MKTYLYLILSLSAFALICCKKQESKNFATYYSSVNVIHTPLSLSCGIHEDQLKNSKQDTSLTKFFHLPENLAGRLYPNEAFITLLYGYPGDYMVPILYTFTKDGVQIDSLVVGGNCFADPGYISSSCTFFDEKLVFTIIDSVKTIAIDSAYNEIQGTDSLFIGTIHYKLNNTGKFTFLDSTRIYVAK